MQKSTSSISQVKTNKGSRKDHSPRSDAKISISIAETIIATLNDTQEKLPNIYINKEPVSVNGCKTLPAIQITYKNNIFEDLRVIGNLITTKLIEAIQNSISYITSLRFEYCYLRSEHITLIRDILLNNPQITSISLNGNSEIQQNVSILLDQTNLKHLSLAQCQINDICLASLCEYLKTNNSLIYLNLSGNYIDIDALEFVTYTLRTNRTLLVLNICDNYIAPDGFLIFFQIFKCFNLKPSEITLRRRLIFKELLENEQKKSVSNFSINSTKRSFSKKSGNYETSSKRSMDSGLTKNIKCTHPFVSDSEPKDGEIICKGNNALQYVNISYNDINEKVITEIISVLRYQRTEIINSNNENGALLKVVMDKNTCNKYPALVEEITNLYSMSKKSSNISQPPRSMKRSESAFL